MDEYDKFDKIANSKWTRLANFTLRLIIINLCMVFSTILTLGVALVPAIFSGYATMKQLDGSENIAKVFWRNILKYFKHGFIFGILSLIIWIIICGNFIFYSMYEPTVMIVTGKYITGLIGIIYFIVSIFYIPILIIYPGKKIKQRLHIAFFLFMSNMLRTILLLLKLCALVVVMLLFPQYAMIISFAAWIYIIYRDVSNMVDKTVTKYEKNKENI